MAAAVGGSPGGLENAAVFAALAAGAAGAAPLAAAALAAAAYLGLHPLLLTVAPPAGPSPSQECALREAKGSMELMVRRLCVHAAKWQRPAGSAPGPAARSCRLCRFPPSSRAARTCSNSSTAQLSQPLRPMQMRRAHVSAVTCSILWTPE